MACDTSLSHPPTSIKVIPQWKLFVNSSVLNVAFPCRGKNERWEIEILFRCCIKKCERTNRAYISHTNQHPSFLSWLQPSLYQVPTSILSFSWNHPFGKLLQDVVEEELETSVWEDSNECGGQTSVESLRPFCLVHGHHCMAKVGVDLDNKEEAEWLSSELKNSKPKVRSFPSNGYRNFPLPKIQLTVFSTKWWARWFSTPSVFC